MNAYVNHGRWVADCATAYCEEAHLVSPGDRFKCANCGETYDVTFPDDMLLIDAALSGRKVPQTRNWYPHETVADLIRENAEHGVVV